MSKSDLCWALVKLLAAVLLYHGVAGLFGGWLAWSSISETIESLDEKGATRATAPIRVLLLGSLFPLLLGIYLAVSGRLAHRLLMSVPLGRDQHDQPSEIPGIGLTGHELEQFKRWLETNPKMSQRARVDQVALFRDAQNAGEA